VGGGGSGRPAPTGTDSMFHVKQNGRGS
jgi:hypothetical protein